MIFIRDLSVGERQAAVEDELEEARLRQDKLQDEIDGLRTRLGTVTHAYRDRRTSTSGKRCR